jgi:hypothetical protein
MYLHKSKPLDVLWEVEGRKRERGEEEKLTLKSVHGGGSKSSLLSVVGNQLCHPSVTAKDEMSSDLLWGMGDGKRQRTHAIVRGTQLPPIDDTM